MYAPVFLSAQPATEAVQAAERASLRAEGPYHVAGRYFASEANARQERRNEAERFVRLAARFVSAAERETTNNRELGRAA
jgi:hypothetical protein